MRKSPYFRRHASRLLLAAAALLLPKFSAGEQPAPNDTDAGPQVRQLIEQLGDNGFTVRERATEELIRKGIVARPYLSQALESPDAEIRFRARRILAIIVAADFENRLSAFAADLDDRHQYSLPGWASFKQVMGAEPPARALFVEMQQAEAALLDAQEQGPKQASAAIGLRARVVYPQVQVKGRANREQASANLGTLVALLWVAGDPAVEVPDEIAVRLIDLPRLQAFETALARASAPRKQLLRSVLGRWISREINPALVARNLWLAANHNLPEGVRPAVRLLGHKNASSEARCSALMVLGKLGNKEHLPLVEARFDDTDPCANFGGINRRLQTQVRDVALAVSIQLAGQDPRQFGFEELQIDEQGSFQLNTLGFAMDSDRAEALASWETWKNANLHALAPASSSKPVAN